MNERDSFRIWTATQVDRDAIVLWTTIVLGFLGYALPEILKWL